MRKFSKYSDDMLSFEGKLLVSFRPAPMFALRVWEIGRTGSKPLWRQLYNAFMPPYAEPPWSPDFLNFMCRDDSSWSKYSRDILFLWDGAIFSQRSFSVEYEDFTVSQLVPPNFNPFENLYIVSEGGELLDFITSASLSFDIRTVGVLQRDIERKVLRKGI